jgi:hypothetical protein
MKATLRLVTAMLGLGRLGGGPANAEEPFNIHAAPCFGPCVSGALPDGVQIAGPFDGTTHRKPQLSDTFRIPGLLAHLLKTTSMEHRKSSTIMLIVVGKFVLSSILQQLLQNWALLPY